MKCPYCAEEIQDEAVKCRFCGEWLTETGTRPNGTTTTTPSSFDLVLEAAGSNKIQMFKNVRDLARLSPKQAKDLVDNTPSVVLSGVDRASASAGREVLLRETSGAAIRLVPHSAGVELWMAPTTHSPRCPVCGSTSVRRITDGRRAGIVELIGVFGAPKAMKSYGCLSCRARWQIRSGDRFVVTRHPRHGAEPASGVEAPHPTPQ